MKAKKYIAIFLGLILLVGVFSFVPLSFPPLNRLVIYLLERRLDAQIDCKSMRQKLFSLLEAEDIKASGKDGVTILIKKGSFTYSPASLVTRRLEIDCRLEDVTVLGKASILELLAGLLSMEKLVDNLKFYDVKGTFFVGMEDTITEDLRGMSEYMQFCVNGITAKDNSISLRVRLLIKEDLSDSIPKELKNTLFKKEEGPWISMTTAITGNYKKPSLRLLCKGFSLDIGIKK